MKKIMIIVILLMFSLVSFSCQTTENISEEIIFYEDEVLYEGEDTETIITFANIQFLPESAVLLESEIIKLQEIAEILVAFPENDLLIVGHAVLAGTPEGRQKLSANRATAVAVYLVEQGIKTKEQIFMSGVGADDQIVPDDTPKNKARNRRVEITVIE